MRAENYHGKEHRGVTEKNIVVLSNTRKCIVSERRKLPRKEDRGATEKNIVVLANTRKSVVDESRKITTEKRIVVPRKRGSWS
jgi:hypothetical protein